MINKEQSEFLEDYKLLEEKARELLPEAMKAQLSTREQEHTHAEVFEISSINDYGVSFDADYNDVCSCHPEKATVIVSWELLQ